MSFVLTCVQKRLSKPPLTSAQLPNLVLEFENLTHYVCDGNHAIHGSNG